MTYHSVDRSLSSVHRTIQKVPVSWRLNFVLNRRLFTDDYADVSIWDAVVAQGHLGLTEAYIALV